MSASEVVALLGTKLCGSCVVSCREPYGPQCSLQFVHIHTGVGTESPAYTCHVSTISSRARFPFQVLKHQIWTPHAQLCGRERCECAAASQFGLSLLWRSDVFEVYRALPYRAKDRTIILAFEHAALGELVFSAALNSYSSGLARPSNRRRAGVRYAAPGSSAETSRIHEQRQAV